MNTRISIDDLIEIVKTGGKVKTGVDVYNKNGILLLDKNVLVDKVKILEIIRENGINSVPVNQSLNGELWDGSGNLIRLNSDGMIDIDLILNLKTNIFKIDDKHSNIFMHASNVVKLV